jgi:hypothetical protein
VRAEREQRESREQTVEKRREQRADSKIAEESDLSVLFEAFRDKGGDLTNNGGIHRTHSDHLMVSRDVICVMRCL